MVRDKYPIILRIVVGIPALLLVVPLWVIILVISSKSLGKVLERTGKRLQEKD